MTQKYFKKGLSIILVLALTLLCFYPVDASDKIYKSKNLITSTSCPKAKQIKINFTVPAKTTISYEVYLDCAKYTNRDLYSKNSIKGTIKNTSSKAATKSKTVTTLYASDLYKVTAEYHVGRYYYNDSEYATSAKKKEITRIKTWTKEDINKIREYVSNGGGTMNLVGTLSDATAVAGIGFSASVKFAAKHSLSKAAKAAIGIAGSGATAIGGVISVYSTMYKKAISEDVKKIKGTIFEYPAPGMTTTIVYKPQGIRKGYKIYLSSKYKNEDKVDKDVYLGSCECLVK